jgi:glucose-1-phosphate thymidylyltransferase
VKAIILAAGYATRLRPLTDSIAKQLLPVGGRPMLDWIADKVDEIPDVDEVHLVTNARYADSFREWALGRGGVEVHDDGTISNEDRLGAVGDIQFVLDRIGTGDELFVIAGDNLFEFSLADYVEWWRGKGDGSSIAVYDVGDFELVKHYGVVEMDENDRVTDLVEKPQNPKSTLAAIATYVYHRDHVPLVREYLDAGNAPDAPGNFTVWLHKREPVYGYRIVGQWFDVGTPAQLLEADNRWRERAGLPQRAEYSVQS